MKSRAAKDARYRAAHIEAVRRHDRERKKAWHKRHVRAHRNSVRQWRKNNPEKAKAKDRLNRVRRQRYKHRNGGKYTAEQWLRLKQRFGNKCLCCKRTERQLMQSGLKLVPDHVVALAKGGMNRIDNIQPLCHGKGGCNNAKGIRCTDYRTADEQRASEGLKAS